MGLTLLLHIKGKGLFRIFTEMEQCAPARNIFIQEKMLILLIQRGMWGPEFIEMIQWISKFTVIHNLIYTKIHSSEFGKTCLQDTCTLPYQVNTMQILGLLCNYKLGLGCTKLQLAIWILVSNVEYIHLILTLI